METLSKARVLELLTNETPDPLEYPPDHFKRYINDGKRELSGIIKNAINCGELDGVGD